MPIGDSISQRKWFVNTLPIFFNGMHVWHLCMHKIFLLKFTEENGQRPVKILDKKKFYAQISLSEQNWLFEPTPAFLQSELIYFSNCKNLRCF